MPPPASVASVASLPPSSLPAGTLTPLSSLFPPTIHSLPSITPTDPPATPLLLSPSFPPVPAKLVTKSQSGAFVALKEFLGDNIALVQHLDEVQSTSLRSSARMRNLSSPIQWAFCFLTYAATRCKDPETRNLLAYGRIILTLAQRHGGQGWLEYDRAFRQQATADPSIPWNRLNPSLMAATVLSAPSSTPATFCPHCQEVDHKGGDCALTSVDPYLEQPTNTAPSHSQTIRPRPYTRPPPVDEICRRFNRGMCPESSRCRYKHICSVPDCLRPGHGAYSCPLKRTCSEPVWGHPQSDFATR